MQKVSAYGLTSEVHRGTGRVRSARHRFDCSFTVVQFQDGSIYVGCSGLPAMIHLATELDQFSGVLDDGRPVMGMLYGFLSHSFEHPDLEPHDSVFGARHVSIGEPSSGGKWTYTLTNLAVNQRLVVQLDDCEAEVLPVDGFEEAKSFLSSTFAIAVTSMLRFAAPDVDSANQIAEDVCVLLSLGTGSRVQWIAHESSTDDQVVRRDLVAAVTKRFSHAAGVHPQDLQHFLTSCSPMSRHVRERWKLRNLIGLQSDARTSVDFLELRCVKTVVAMEAVKDIFLSDTGGEDPIRSPADFERVRRDLKRALRTSLAIHGWTPEECHESAASLAAFNRRSFGSTLRRLLKEIGSTLGESDIKWFVKCRNAAVHTGRPWTMQNEALREAPFQDHIEEYVWLQRFLSRVLLSIAGYRGPIIDSSGPNKRAKYDAP